MVSIKAKLCLRFSVLKHNILDYVKIYHVLIQHNNQPTKKNPNHIQNTKIDDLFKDNFFHNFCGIHINVSKNKNEFFIKFRTEKENILINHRI